MSYTYLRTKVTHFLSRIDICCFCVERHCCVLQIVCFCFPADSNHCLYNCKGEKKGDLCQCFRVSKKVLSFLFRVFCSVFTSCLRATHANRLTESCVHRSSVAVLDFITSLQLFLHIFALKCAIRDCFCYHLTSL